MFVKCGRMNVAAVSALLFVGRGLAHHTALFCSHFTLQCISCQAVCANRTALHATARTARSCARYDVHHVPRAALAVPGLLSSCRRSLLFIELSSPLPPSPDPSTQSSRTVSFARTRCGVVILVSRASKVVTAHLRVLRHRLDRLREFVHSESAILDHLT